MDSFKSRSFHVVLLLISWFETCPAEPDFPRPPFPVTQYRAEEYSAPEPYTAEQRPEPPRPPFSYFYPATESPSSGYTETNSSLEISESKYALTKNYCDSRDPPGCLKRTLSFCANDYDYPGPSIRKAIEKDDRVLKKMADVASQSTEDLVDGLGYYREEYFDYSTYSGREFDKGNWFGSEGYICPSTVLYVKPSRARNVQGDWRVIVQGSEHYTQTERIEKCLYPGKSCRYLPPCYKTRCVQKYAHRRLLSFDPCHPERGLFMDIFKLPSACSCSIKFDYYF